LQIDVDGWSAAKDVLTDAVGIWVAWATSERGIVDTPPSAAAAATAAATGQQPPAGQGAASTELGQVRKLQGCVLPIGTQYTH